MQKTRFPLLVLLVAAMASGPMLGYGLSASSAVVIERVGISAGQLGGLASLSFVTAALGSLGFGRLADHLGIRAQLVLIHGLSILSLVLAAAASQYWMLVLAAVCAGLPLATSNPTTNRIIVRHVPHDRRSVWIGTKQSGVQVAQLFSGLFFPVLTLWLGWAGAAIGAAVVVALLLVQAMAALPGDPEPPTPAGQGHPGPPRPATLAGRRLPGVVWYLAGISLLSGAGMQATNVYLPLFAVQSLDYGLVVGGVAAGVTGTVGVMSRLFWSRRLQGGARPTTLLVVIFVGAILSGASLLAANLGDVRGLLWVGAVLLGGSTLGVSVVVNATIVRVVVRERVGAATGVTAMGMYVGFAAGPLVMGAVRDVTGDFWWGWAIVVAVYTAGLVLSLALRWRGPGAEQSGQS